MHAVLSYHSASKANLEAPEGAIFTVHARVLNRGSARSCSAWVKFYEDPGCSGDESIFDPFGPWPPNAVGIWESSGYTSGALWDTASSMRVVFELVGSGVCWYDDAYLSYAHGPEEIPTLTESALALQALLLAALAVRALRKLRPPRR